MIALAFVDIETTGLVPIVAAITELAVIRVDSSPDRAVEWSTLIAPGRPSPARINIMTGISDDTAREIERLTAGACYTTRCAASTRV